MENEYSHLERLVNDVTNLDTARMTLRWALERLHALEKTNAELKRDFTAAQAAREQAEQKAESIGQSMESRSKSLNEQEGFHKKMEATLELLSSGKIDVTHLVRKEAQLDNLRRELAEDYQRRFENLDKTQAQIAQRWNQRLLNVESQYAERLVESQTHYDGLRRSLEKEHQARLARLEASFKDREKELLERVNTLEESVKFHDNAVENRRTALELEVLAKKTELEHNYQKLKSALETNFDARVRIMDGEHAKRTRSLEATWEVERIRLLEEQQARENQFKTAQDSIKELEESLARQQVKHHAELIERIREGESAFREKVNRLEKDHLARSQEYDRQAKNLNEREAGLDAKLDAARRDLKAEFRDREKQLESDLRDRESGIARLKEAAVRNDADWSEKLRKLEHDVIWKKTAELDMKYQEREAGLKAREEELRVKFEEMFHERVVEHDADMKTLREGFDKERKQLRSEISAREVAIRDITAESDLISREAIKETSGLKTKLEASRRDMEAGFRDREKQLESDIRDRESGIARLKEAAVHNDAEWAERLRKLEHDVIWKKTAELDMKYNERKARLRTREDELRSKFEEMFHERVVEHDADMKTLREGFDKERKQLRFEISAREVTIRDITAESDLISREAIKETSGLKTKLEAARRDMEAEFRDREKQLESDLRDHESGIARLKEAAVRSDADWSEKLRKLEHDVIWKKMAELDMKYNEREAGLQAREEELRVKFEEMFHRRVVEHEAVVKVLREGFDKERKQLRFEISARDAMILEFSAESGKISVEKLKEELRKAISRHKEK